VTGSNDFNLKLWDVKAGQEKSRLTGHMSAITDVAYSVRWYLWELLFTVQCFDTFNYLSWRLYTCKTSTSGNSKGLSLQHLANLWFPWQIDWSVH